MSSAITLAGQTRINQLRGEEKPLVIDRMVLALVPGLDPTQPVDRNQQMPSGEHIVHTYTIDAAHKGYVNPDQVVYSMILGSDVGDFSFNWIGTVEAVTGKVITVTVTPSTPKRKTDLASNTTGNNITRNVMMQFQDAQALTGVSISAETWQFDYTEWVKEIVKSHTDREDLHASVDEKNYWNGKMDVGAFGIGKYADLRTLKVPGTNVAYQKALPNDFFDAKGGYVCGLAEGIIIGLPSTHVFLEFCMGYGDISYSGSIFRRAIAHGIVYTSSIVSNTEWSGWKSETVNSQKLDGQTLTEIKDEVAGIFNRGISKIDFFDCEVPPPGWLEANGSECPGMATTLNALLAGRHGVGAGGRSLLPDLRGEFVRGWDNGRGIDVGRELGSWQPSVSNHLKTVVWGTNSGNRGSVNVPANGAVSAAVFIGSTSGDSLMFVNSGADTISRNNAYLVCVYAGI